ncbi:hypothetical protein CP082626L3_1091A, partial [Chlamydia psittaci 08-2626_L3]
MLKLR